MSALGTKLALVREAQRLHGMGEAARVAWSGLRHAGSLRIFLYALSQPRPLPRAIEVARGHTFAFATAEQLRRYAVDPAAGIEAVDIERVSRGTARCLLQLAGGELVGYAWVWSSQLAFIEEGFHINLPDDTIYNYKSYTAPAYRGAAFQGLRHLELLDRLRSEGKRRLFGFVHHLNSSSLRGVHKSGYDRVGELRLRKDKGSVQATLVTRRDFWCETPRG